MSIPFSRTVDDAALLRFIGDESPADERAAIERWMAADRANAREVTRLAQAWAMAAREPAAAPAPDALWSRIRAGMAEAPPTEAAGAGRPRRATKPALVLMPSPARPRWLTLPLRAAAAIVVVGGAAVLARETMPRADETTPAPMRTYTTRPGERAELRLADGSRVVLGGASSLRIAEAPGDAQRDVYLDGEAYFDVAHDSSRVFRVHMPRSVAEDLGTRFLVTAYSSDESELVAVAEGSVALTGSDSAESVVLRANDVGRVTAEGAVHATRNVDIARHLGWMDGVIQFEDELLGDAARVIERQYGVRIRIADSALSRRRFTGSIRAASVHADLRGLALLLDAQYARRGEEVTLTPLREPAPAVVR